MTTKITDLKKQDDKTFILNLTIKKEEINHTQEHVLKEIQADFESKGFRKGKAPLEVVKNNISETKLIEEVLTHVVSEEYQKKINEHHLHPIVQPQVKVLNPPITLDKDWQIEITGCELPEISIDPKYLDDVKKINAGKESDNEKLNLTIEAINKHSKVTIPEILVLADMENKLSQLVDQTQQAGITVDAYLKSRKMTLEDYKSTLSKQIHNEWITNLAIDKIAKDEKIEVSQEEVEKLVSTNQALSKNLNLVYYLLTQQKVFDYLKKI